MDKNKNLRVIFFGTPDFVLPVAKKLAEDFELVGVVTSPDMPQGRKRTLVPTDVKKWYMEHLLKTNTEGVILTPEKLTTDSAIKLRKLHPDLFVVAAYGKLVPEEILAIPTLGSLNIHPSLLPNYRGPAPIQNALLNGDEELGITIMKMDEELDHGPIVTQWTIPIKPSDTFASLHEKAFLDAADKLPVVIKKYADKSLLPVPQKHDLAFFTERIEREHGYFAIDNPPEKTALQRMIRAYYPWPGVWTNVNVKGKVQRLKFLPDGIFQLEGGKPVKLKELLNGHAELRPQLEKLGIL